MKHPEPKDRKELKNRLTARCLVCKFLQVENAATFVSAGDVGGCRLWSDGSAAEAAIAGDDRLR
jgi:hypothetical protein